MGVQLKPSVVVIGGGCAGLAAATELASAGVPITLFDAGRQLGGRARGLNWKGKRLDNGQHILLGAYSETLRLLQLAGVNPATAFMRLPLQLIQHRNFRLRASRYLPAPLHIVSGILRAQGLSTIERLAALRFMTTLKLTRFKLAQDEPLSGFLSRHRQPEKLIQWIWEPLCLAALNTPLEQASTQVFLNVLRDSFSRARADSNLLLPRTDLSTLIADPLSSYARGAGSDIRLNASVSSIRKTEQGFDLQCGDEIYPCSHVILATSPFGSIELIQSFPELANTTRQLRNFDYQPIYTVYLQYPEQAQLPFPMLGLSGRYAQWVFDRGALDGQTGLLAVVISAEGKHQSLTQENLATTVAEELAHQFPELPSPIWHKVIAEKRATFTCRAGLQRPAQRTAIKNLYLAGDYTEGDYPATIEGAVRSGVKCARSILESL